MKVLRSTFRLLIVAVGSVAAMLAFSLPAGAAVTIFAVNPDIGKLVSIQANPFTTSGFTTTVVGDTQLGLSGLSFQPGTGVLFGSVGADKTEVGKVNAGRLYTISTTTGAATPTAIGGPIPAGPGGLAAIAFAANGKLFGSTSTVFQGPSDSLLNVNPTTGARTVIGATPAGIGALAINPLTGVLYGAASTPDAGLAGHADIYTIDKTTGVSTLLTSLSDLRAGTFLAGLAFDSLGNLYGATGTNSGGYILSIDLTKSSSMELGRGFVGAVSDIAIFVPTATVPTTPLPLAVWPALTTLVGLGMLKIVRKLPTSAIS